MKTSKPNSQKIAQVASLQELISQAKCVAVVDYTGMKVSQATELRRSLKKAGGYLLVTKNTLFKIATGLKDFQPTGLNAFIFCQSDEISPLKAVADFAKKNHILNFTTGFLGDRVLTAAEVSRLSSLPDRTTNYQLLTSGLNSPLFRLVYSLNWNVSKLVRTLEVIKQSKST